MKIIDLTTTTEKLATAMGLDLAGFNAGVYDGTSIPVRRMTGQEIVRVYGTSAGAKVEAESWIVDRFGALGARQIKRLLAA